MEFAAEYARWVVVMFDGRITDDGSKYRALKGSAFYSPQIARLFNSIMDHVLAIDDAIRVMKDVAGQSCRPANSANSRLVSVQVQEPVLPTREEVICRSQQISWRARWPITR